MENNVENATPVVENIPATPAAPVAEPAKKSAKKFILPCILVGVLVVLLVAGIVVKSIMSSPKRVFTNVINSTYKEVSTTLKELDEFYKPDKEAVEFGASIKVDTNLDPKELDLPEGIDLSKIDFSKLEVNGKFGLDIPNEEVMAEANIKGSSETIGAKAYVKGDKIYIKPTFYDKVIEFNMAEGEIDFSDIKKELEKTDEVDIDLMLYDSILAAVTDAFTNALDKDAMSKESAEIDVLGKEVKVTKNSYKINDKSVQKLVKGTVENLLNDKKFVKNLAKATGLEEDKIKDALKEAKKNASNIKVGSVIVVNVYTKGLLNKPVGFDINMDKVKLISWYTNGGNIEAEINAGKKIKLSVEEGKKESEAKLTYDGKKIATATIRSFDEEAVDFDYEINLSEFNSSLKNAKGTIKFTCKKEKKKYSGEYKFRGEYDGKFGETSGTYYIEAKDKLDGLDTGSAVKEDDVNEEELNKALMNVIDKDETFKNIKDLVEKSVKDKPGFDDTDPYNAGPEYDEDDVKGYKEVSSEAEAVSLLTSTSPTVLYVRPTNDNQVKDQTEAILEAQAISLKYSAWVIDADDVGESFKAATANVEYKCYANLSSEEKTCKREEIDKDMPIVYIIKDGKIAKAMAGDLTFSFTKALSELGILN